MMIQPSLLMDTKYLQQEIWLCMATVCAILVEEVILASKSIFVCGIHHIVLE